MKHLKQKIFDSYRYKKSFDKDSDIYINVIFNINFDMT